VHPAVIFGQMVLGGLAVAIAGELIPTGGQDGAAREISIYGVHRGRKPIVAPSGSGPFRWPASRPGCRRQRLLDPQAHAVAPLVHVNVHCRASGRALRSNGQGGGIFVDKNMGDKTRIPLPDVRMPAFAEKGAARA